jgi:hypothetical protein
MLSGIGRAAVGPIKKRKQQENDVLGHPMISDPETALR